MTLAHVALKVRDVARSRAFYERRFGMRPAWTPDPGNAYLTPDERVQPGYSYLGLRDLYKRLRYVSTPTARSRRACGCTPPAAIPCMPGCPT